MVQVTLADNTGLLSACFCVKRRERRRLLDLSMRVTVYNPLTASSSWRMAAVLTELKHDAVIGLPGTQKRVAVDAPLCQSHKFNGAWVFHGDFDVELTSQTEALVCRCSSRLVGTDKDIYIGYFVPLLPLSGRCGSAVVKNGLGHFCFIVLYLPPKPSGRVKQHLVARRWMLCTN